MNDVAAPHARMRWRKGLCPLDWTISPLIDEAWPDLVRVELIGDVRWPSEVSFHDYLSEIMRRGVFTKQPTEGRRFRASIACGSVTGEVTIAMRPGAPADVKHVGAASVKLQLRLNPTRTRSHVIRRTRDVAGELSARDFFCCLPSVAEVFEEGQFSDQDERSADGKDNVLLTVPELGGATPARRRTARTDFLALYETKLRELISYIFSPCGHGPDFDDRLGNARNDVMVEFRWNDIRLQHAEIYVERATKEPVSVVRRLHDRAPMLARSIKTQNFAVGPGWSCAIEVESGLPQVVVPLTGSRNIQLSVYAKTNKRVRFEIRYLREFSGIIKRADRERGRLASSLNLLLADAVKRMPWAALQSAIRSGPSPNIADIEALFSALHSALIGHNSLVQPFYRGVILIGSIIADEARHPGSTAVIKRLVRQGVLEHWPVQQKEAKESRVYGLTARFREVRLQMLTGFMPQDDSGTEPVEAKEFGDDHLEQAAKLNGSRAFVYKGYN